MAQGKRGTGLSGTYKGKPCKYGHDGTRYKNGGGCITCMKEQSRRQWQDDPSFRERKRQAARKIYPTTLRNRNLLRDYGITLAQYDSMLIEQGNVCGICGGLAGGSSGRFHVDHDHLTNKVRALLCYTCNIGLGSFKDSPEL